MLSTVSVYTGAIVTKPVLLLAYLLSYYIILVCIFFFIIFCNIRSLKYFSEFSFYSNYAGTSMLLILALLALSGLPPFFFFFAKLGILAYIIMHAAPVTSMLSCLLVFIGWYIYLNAARVTNNAAWSFSSPTAWGSRYVNSVGSIMLLACCWFLIIGGFFFQDILLYVSWFLL